MIIYEFRESMLDKAMDQLDEAKYGIKMSKKALCAIEDLLCDLYEEEHDEYEEPVNNEKTGDEYEAIVEGNDIEVNYRGRSGMRGEMRMRENMPSMRSGMRSGMRSNMRMRKAGRYNY